MIDRSENYGRHLIEAFAAYTRAGTVVDLGAGRGTDLNNIRNVLPNIRSIGIETNRSSQAELKSNGHEVIALDIEQEMLPFDDSSIDLIVANQIFEHLKEVFWVCHEISRVTPVGGHFIVGVPNLASLHNRLLLLVGRQPSSQRNWSAHVRGYTRTDLLELMNRPFPGGWRQVSWGGSNFYPFPPHMARPLAKLLPGMAWGIFLLLRKEREYEGSYLSWPVEQSLETNFRTTGVMR